MLHKHLLSSRVNTRKPEQAKVFFIPVYLGRYFNVQWQRYSDPSDAWLINKDCHDLSPWDCWAEKWQVATNVSDCPSMPHPVRETLAFPRSMPRHGCGPATLDTAACPSAVVAVQASWKAC